MWTFRFWEHLMQDTRYGLRTMARSKVFTAMAVLSLALGIGANTAIYSFLNALLIRSLPVSNPDELAIIRWVSGGRPAVVHGMNGSMFREGASGRTSPNIPFAAWQTFRDARDVASSVFAYAVAYELNLVARNQADASYGLYVSGNFFQGLGVVPAAGRLLTDADDAAGSHPAAVISHEFWRRRYAMQHNAVGSVLLINRMPFTVVGVSAPGFTGVDQSSAPTVFMPLHARVLLSSKPAEEQRRFFLDRNFYWLETMARLRPGVTAEQAQAALGAVYRQFALSTASNDKERASIPSLRVDPGGGGLNTLRRQYTKPLYVLMVMVGLILLIACANIANLLLARATARRREIAVRLSLGSGRGRVVRQLLTESILLSLMGGVLGIGVAIWAVRSIAWLLSDGREDLVLRAPLDWNVFAFTAALALLTGIVFGLAPAVQATGGDAVPALKESRIGGWKGRSGISRGRLSQVLMVTQIAVSLVLAIAAGLFVRSLNRLHSIELGFNRENLLIFNVNAKQAGYRDRAMNRLYENLGEQFRRIPGVTSASFSNFPLAAYYFNDTQVSIPDRPSADGKPRSSAVVIAGPDYLATMQIPLVLGRDLHARDMAAPRSVVVSQVFAGKYFPGESPLGRHVLVGSDKTDAEIVGVAKTAAYNSLSEEERPPVLYVPYTMPGQDVGGVWYHLRTAGDPLNAATAVRRIVHEAAPLMPVARMKTQAAQIEQTISQQRTFANLCAAFAALALLIACVGLYGMMAYAVARRTSEIGIRVALGAARGAIVWMMLRQVLVLAVIGLAIGLIAAWRTAHLVGSFLYGITTWDAPAFWGSAAVLLAAAIAAGYGPARRAARVDPMVALRNE